MARDRSDRIDQVVREILYQGLGVDDMEDIMIEVEAQTDAQS
jgi:hypothetical protein